MAAMTRPVKRTHADTAGARTSLGKTLDFMQLLWALDHSLQEASARMAGQLGVTGPQRLVLRIVGLKPKISAGELARTMHLHPSTLTGILHRLLEHGFVKRLQDPEDGRRALFDLTAEGRRVNDIRSGTVEAAVRRAIAATSPRELVAARLLLDSLTRELARGD